MSIIEFSDWEDAQRKMRDAETKANASVTDRQREIVYGSHWLRAAPDGMLEYGWVIPQDVAERNATKESIRALRDAYERGYRFSRAHSRSQHRRRARRYTSRGHVADHRGGV